MAREDDRSASYNSTDAGLGAASRRASHTTAATSGAETVPPTGIGSACETADATAAVPAGSTTYGSAGAAAWLYGNDQTGFRGAD